MKRLMLLALTLVLAGCAAPATSNDTGPGPRDAPDSPHQTTPGGRPVDAASSGDDHRPFPERYTGGDSVNVWLGHPCQDGALACGREGAAGVVFELPGVAPQHARLVVEWDAGTTAAEPAHLMLYDASSASHPLILSAEGTSPLTIDVPAHTLGAITGEVGIGVRPTDVGGAFISQAFTFELVVQYAPDAPAA